MNELVWNAINWGVSLAWFGLVAWVYVDGKKNGVEKAGKWAMKLLLNPFAVRKYMRVRGSQA